MDGGRFGHESNPQDHYVGSLYEGCGSLSTLELHFSGRACRDDRRDLLTTDENPDLSHQTANLHGLNSSYQLIATTQAPDFIFALLLGLGAGSEKQPVHFALRNTMMSSRSPIASNLVPVNPLLNRWKTDPQLQSCVSKLQQSLNIPLGFAVLAHRDAIVTTTKFPVNSVASA
jgi:hypothetical protein